MKEERAIFKGKASNVMKMLKDFSLLLSHALYLKDSKVGKCTERLARVSLWKGKMTYVKQTTFSLLKTKKCFGSFSMRKGKHKWRVTP